MEFRVLRHAELRAADSGRTIAGLAAPFNVNSLPLPRGGTYYREKIAPGAFARSLRGDNSAGDVLACYNHEPGKLLGRTASGTLRLEETDAGLAMEVDLPDTQLGREVHTLVRRGDIRGCSFGFAIRGQSWNADHSERTLTDIDLFEISPVAVPAYSSTHLEARSLTRPADGEILQYAFPLRPHELDELERARRLAEIELLRRL
ncbi:MAG: HK97 family phage prohead protease [Candidatus Angelobacter sp.]